MASIVTVSAYHSSGTNAVSPGGIGDGGEYTRGRGGDGGGGGGGGGVADASQPATVAATGAPLASTGAPAQNCASVRPAAHA